MPSHIVKISDLRKIDDIITVDLMDGGRKMGTYKLSHAKLKFR